MVIWTEVCKVRNCVTVRAHCVRSLAGCSSLFDLGDDWLHPRDQHECSTAHVQRRTEYTVSICVPLVLFHTDLLPWPLKRYFTVAALVCLPAGSGTSQLEVLAAPGPHRDTRLLIFDGKMKLQSKTAIFYKYKVFCKSREMDLLRMKETPDLFGG